MSQHLQFTGRKAAITFTLSALLLSACGQLNNNGSGVRLPQGYRVASSSASDFLERRSGRIAVARIDGNIIVIDQTGQGEVMLTRDGGATLLKDRSGILERRFGLPVWSREGDQVALVETRVRFPMVQSVTYDGGVNVAGQAFPGGRVVSETITGPQTTESEEVVQFEQAVRRVTLEMGGSVLGSTLYVASPDGKGVLNEVLTTEDEIQAIDWSPAGDQIGVLSSGRQGPKLALTSLDGQTKTPVTDGADIAWSWGADANTVLARTQLDPKSLRSDVKLFATDNGEELAAVTPREAVHATSVGYSPDGKFLIVTQPDGEDGYAMYIADQDGKPLRKLTSGRGVVSYTWAPSGSMLAYIERANPRAPAGRLRMLDVNGGDPVTVSQLPVVGFFWSPDAKSLITFSPSSTAGIDPNGASIVLVDQSVTEPMLVQTIYADTRQSRELFYAELSPVFMQVLTQSDRFSRMMTIWSPDSKRVIVPIMYSGQGERVPLIVQSEASGSVFPRSIAVGMFASWSPK
jgi:dipeptidyl aminopeptidase/acylaminoacyl peptidase